MRRFPGLGVILIILAVLMLSAHTFTFYRAPLVGPAIGPPNYFAWNPAPPYVFFNPFTAIAALVAGFIILMMFRNARA